MSCKCKAFDGNFSFRHERRATVSCHDKKSVTRYIYNNQRTDNLALYRVDGGLISDNGAKCDYLLLNCEKQEAFFIELKGSDLIRAIEQIDRSIDLLQREISDFIINARIVLTRVNATDLRDTRYLKLERKVKNFRGSMDKKSQIMCEVNH